MSIPDYIEEARALDAADPIRHLRDQFALPDSLVYLDGNSLGALPKVTLDRLTNVISQQWGRDLIKSWLVHEWMLLPNSVGDKIARLVGAHAGEVVATDSTSVNLYKCVLAALQLRPGRRTILTEAGNFPTDLYVLDGIQRHVASGVELKVLDSEAILQGIDASVAVVVLTHVHYKSALKHDMEGITRRAHEQGALVVWDLSHSAGALAVDLNRCNVDFAVGCGYKYLNGGPGSPAYVFVAARHQLAAHCPLTGWLGHARPFEFRDEFEPAPGINRFLCGTHGVLGLSALDAGLDIFLSAPAEAIWEKSRKLCEFFVKLVDLNCVPLGVSVASPRDPTVRGSHIGLRYPHALPVVENLIAQGVVGDYRAPDIMRFGFAPLYVRFEDVARAVGTLREVLQSRSWDQPHFRVRRASG